MPLITIDNLNSPAYGEFATWYDTSKPRVASKKARQQSLKRQNDYRRAAGLKPLRQEDVHSVHHLHKDRSEGHPDGLFNCDSQEQHNKIEMQATEMFTILFNMGKIGFDYVTKKYFFACDELRKAISDWCAKGQPKQWDIRGIHAKV